MTNTSNTTSHRDWIGSDVYDSTGDKVGSVDNIFVDDRTGQPEWLTVSTGWFGTKTQFVPIAGTSRHQNGIKVPYTTDHIKDAPSIDADEHLSNSDERRLYQHYSMNYDATDHAEMYGGRERADEGYYYDDHGSRDAEVTLSEEQLEVDKREREAGKVRLRKYVVTEDVNVTVPVKKQVARVVRTPASGTAAGSIGDDDVVEEITLKEEEVVVDKNVVAKENVAIRTDTVTEQEQVSGQVRREEVDIEGDAEGVARSDDARSGRRG